MVFLAKKIDNGPAAIRGAAGRNSEMQRLFAKGF